MSDVVQVDDEARVLVIAINRPERRNAIDAEVAHGIAAALARLDGEAELRVGVITGRGGTFSSGMDFRAFAAGRQASVPGAGFAGLVERRPSKPLLAAVEGHALGGGCEIALACDLIIAARDAQFALPEVRRGLIPGSGGLFRLSRRIPHNIAVQLILTGESIDAEAAAVLGLVNALTEPGGALEGALALARRIAENAPLAVDLAVQLLRESADWPDAEGFERQRPYLQAVVSSEDAREGARAFLEKRAPHWLGR